MKPSGMALRRQSRELFPGWSRRMRAKWVLARLAAPGMKPLYRARVAPLEREAA